jgi:hypothetical protein
MKKKSFK